MNDAISRWRRFRAGESLETIYPLPADWEEHHEGPRDGAQQQLLTTDAFTLADFAVGIRALGE